MSALWRTGGFVGGGDETTVAAKRKADQKRKREAAALQAGKMMTLQISLESVWAQLEGS